MPHPSRESWGLKLNMLTIARRPGTKPSHIQDPDPRCGVGKENKRLSSFFCHLRASPQYFQHLTITKSRKDEHGQWHPNNVIGTLQKKAGKKGELIQPGSTGIAQGCNKARRTLGQARLQRHIMCSTQSRNKYAILNIFQVYFQKKSRAKMEIAIWY